MVSRERRKGRPARVHAVLRALKLLDVLAQEGREMGVVELSRGVQLHVSTVHRLLGTLMAGEYVQQDSETGRYGLSRKIHQLAQASLGGMDLRRVTRPHLERIAKVSGETANLVVLDKDEACYLDKVESQQSLTFLTKIGHRAPLHCTAVGKVFLAHLPEEERDEILNRITLLPHTRNTITSLPQLRRELKKTVVQEFAVDREECEEGASCLAVPIRDYTGRVVAAAGISGPSVRLTDRRVSELVSFMLEEGRRVSAGLGYRGGVDSAGQDRPRKGGRR
ncbi:MAG: IclR family transcriptional regulator [Candidatus Methylomirabilales bacterium]